MKSLRERLAIFGELRRVLSATHADYDPPLPAGVARMPNLVRLPALVLPCNFGSDLSGYVRVPGEGEDSIIVQREIEKPVSDASIAACKVQILEELRVLAAERLDVPTTRIELLTEGGTYR